MDKKQLITEYVDKHVIGGASLRDATATQMYNRVKPGNERTPYVNQIVLGVQVEVNYTETRRNVQNQPYIRLTQMFEVSSDLKAYIELRRLYNEPTDTLYAVDLTDCYCQIQVTATRSFEGTTQEKSYTMDLSGYHTWSINPSHDTVHQIIYSDVASSAISQKRFNVINLDPNLDSPEIDIKVEITKIGFGGVAINIAECNLDIIKRVTAEDALDFVISVNTPGQVGIQSAYYSWECRDPRQNSEPSDWDLFKGRIKGELTEASIPNLGSANSNVTFNPEDIIE